MVRAIDRHESILQSPLTERIQQVQQQQPDLQQRYFELQLSQEHRKMQQRINEAAEQDPLHLSGEGERQHREATKQEKRAPRDPGEEPTDDPDHPGLIDIKV